MKHKLDYRNFIDLEYFFHLDQSLSSDHLHERDRKFFRENREDFDKISPDKKQLLNLWLQNRVDHDFPGDTTRSPGAIFNDSHAIIKIFCLIFGVLLGVGTGFSFFTYSGTTPVNVFHFLIYFVYSQIILILILFVSLLFRKIAGTVPVPSFYSLLLGGLFAKIFNFIGKKWTTNLSAAKRNSMAHAVGLIQSNRQIYGSLFYWPLFVISQILVLCFNVGLLFATLFKIATSDLAFGWQSTMQFSSEALHNLVQTMALPWSWLVASSTAYPSIEEIEGSRIILKEGIYNLATADLVAWWPFLVFSLLFYGVFIRSGLYFFGKAMESRSLGKVKLNSSQYRNLFLRMKTHRFSTQARPEPQKKSKETAPRPAQPQPQVKNEDQCSHQIILMPDDIAGEFSQELFEQYIQRHNFVKKEQLKFMVSYDSDLEILHYLQQQVWDEDLGILIVMEAPMPPLEEFLTYLKELRESTSLETIINIALIGLPAKTAFTAIAANDYTGWKQKIHSLGDPYMNLFPLIDSDFPK